MSKYVLKQDNGFSSPSTYSIEGHDDLVNKYAGNSYVQDKLKANPYVSFEGTQTLLGALGDNTGLWRSNLSRNLEERALLYDDYNSKVLQDWENQKRNEPSIQKGLDVQAGLNPDLTGIQGSAQPADEVASSEHPRQGDSVMPMDVVNQVFSGLGGMVSNAMSIFKGFLDLGQFKWNKSMNLLNSIPLLDTIADSFLSDSVLPGERYDDWSSRILDNVVNSNDPKMMSALGVQMPKDLWKTYLTRVGHKANSQDAFNRYVKKYTESYNNLQEYGKASGSPFTKGVNLFELRENKIPDVNKYMDTVNKTISPFLDLEMKVMKGDYNRKISENRYFKNYYGSLNPNAMANWDMMRNKYSKELMGYEVNVKKLTDDMNSVWRKEIGRLRREADNGDIMASALLMSIAFGNFALDKFGGFSSFVNPKTGAHSVGVNLHP